MGLSLLIVLVLVTAIVLFVVLRRKADRPKPRLYGTAAPDSAANDTMAGMHLFPVSEFNPLSSSSGHHAQGGSTPQHEAGQCAASDTGHDSHGGHGADCSGSSFDGGSHHH